ncbi:hypothetical protein BCR44DRAFT_1429758 [Catenaria anguillulae PL171]|uniref:Uncharacterized protein n=1 Tax=Catenaria anguillulae PL171 TaxID=765915 RepID=A0A1Y2HSX6_9FUNG|nr:hypothetical protein BCR44DRAFT_1429758 [Catenaria anguillulae PL171]
MVRRESHGRSVVQLAKACICSLATGVDNQLLNPTYNVINDPQVKLVQRVNSECLVDVVRGLEHGVFLAPQTNLFEMTGRSLLAKRLANGVMRPSC